MSNDSFGFVTAALGKPGYLEMAVDMSLSLRRFHTDPVCVICDAKLAALAKSRFANVFDHIAVIREPLKHPLESNFLAAQLAPFDRGLFLDADILVLSDLNVHIAETRSNSVSMMGEYLERGSGRRHHGIPVDKLLAFSGQQLFLTNHAGMFGYQRETAAAFFDTSRAYWRSLYTPRWRMQGFIGNELGFGLAAAQYGVSIMQKPFPVIWTNEMQKMTVGQAPKPLLHFISAPPKPIMDWQMAEVSRRRMEAGLPTDSAMAWTSKVNHSHIGGRIGKSLNRMFKRIL